jgi:hypothetical protein
MSANYNGAAVLNMWQIEISLSFYAGHFEVFRTVLQSLLDALG